MSTSNNNLQKTLYKYGLTQSQLAKVSGLSFGLINKTARQIITPKISSMEKIVDALGKLTYGRYSLGDIFPVDQSAFADQKYNSKSKRKMAKLQKKADMSPILNLYFDPLLITKEEIREILISLNEIYRGLGGKELVILDNEIGIFNHVDQLELA